MNQYRVVENLPEIFAVQVREPTTTMWNRLEGRPRKKDFDRALRAEVRDPLWLLTRQWQMGEFVGEDAGSPVTAKIAWRTSAVEALRTTSGETVPYDLRALPLEAAIEARPLTLERAGRPFAVDVRLALGRRWQQLLTSAGYPALGATFRATYRFVAPDATAPSDFAVTAHAGTWQTLAAVAGRAIDGGALWIHLERPGARASDGLGLTDPEKSAVDTLGDTFLAWARGRYVRPADPGAWSAQRLSYDAEISAPRDGRPAAIAAPDYRGGHLDWFHFDAAAPGGTTSSTPPPLEVKSFLPATIQFDGMPNTRHWTFEEGIVNFGAIAPDTTDIAKLLLAEFGLVFANDWFLLPLELPIGTLTEVAGLAVTNVFGETFWIDPAVDEVGPVRSWQMFRLSSKGASDPRLFLPPTTTSGLESAPVESVAFVRDEVSNMVWGIETVVELPDGSSRRGRELALELRARYQTAAGPPPAPPERTAKVAYEVMKTPPEHWIPFVPVRVPGDPREIQLQRAGLPRLLEGERGTRPKKIAARTVLLRNGLDGPTPAPYYVAEEEVERAGTVIETRWQRCRWLDGRVVTWLSHERRPGRGEGSGGLAFDLLTPV